MLITVKCSDYCVCHISLRRSPRQHEQPRSYSPRRGDTHAVQVTPHKRSAVWCRSVVSQYGDVARSVVPQRAVW